MSDIMDIFESMEEYPTEQYSLRDKVLTVDAELREINVPADVYLLGVESDEKAERVYFRCPRIVGDNLDLSQFAISINFENAGQEKGAYLSDDAHIVGDYIEFSWLLSRAVTRYKGLVSFIVCAMHYEGEEEIEGLIEWNTTLATLPVLKGIEVTIPYPPIEEADLIKQLIASAGQKITEINVSIDKSNEQIEKSKQQVNVAINEMNQKTDIAVNKANTATDKANNAAEEARTEVWNNKNLTETTIGDIITTTSIHAPLILTEVEGNTIQTVTQGLQAWDNNAATFVINDGSTDVVKTSTGVNYKVAVPERQSAGTYSNVNNLITNKTYYVSFDVVVSSINFKEARFALAATNKFVPSSEFTIGVKKHIQFKAEATNKTLLFYLDTRGHTDVGIQVSITNIMISESESAVFEPYSGLKPSPSVEYPQPIVATANDGSLNLIAQGLNWFDYTKYKTVVSYGVTFKNNQDGTFTVNGIQATKYAETAKLDTSLIPSDYFVSTGTYPLNLTIAKHSIVGSIDYYADRIINIDGTEKYVFSYVQGTEKDKTYINYLTKPLINIGTTKKEFVPYEHSELNIPLTKLRKGDKIKVVKAGESYVDVDGNRITVERDTWGCEVGTYSLVLDGTNDMGWESISANKCRVKVNMGKTIKSAGSSGNLLQNAYSTHYRNVTANQTFLAEQGFSGTGANQQTLFYIYDERYNDGTTEKLNEFKEWCKTNKPEFVLPLLYPYFVPFEDQEIFYNWYSGEKETTIYTTDVTKPVIKTMVAKTPEAQKVLSAYTESLKQRTRMQDDERYVQRSLKTTSLTDIITGQDNTTAVQVYNALGSAAGVPEASSGMYIDYNHDAKNNIMLALMLNGNMYTRGKANGTVYNWIKQPTRGEIDSLFAGLLTRNKTTNLNAEVENSVINEVTIKTFDGASANHTPDGASGFVVTRKTQSNAVNQTAFTYGGSIWSRGFKDNAYTDWERIDTRIITETDINVNTIMLRQFTKHTRMDMYNGGTTGTPNSQSGVVLTQYIDANNATQFAFISDGSIWARTRSASTTVIGNWYHLPGRSEFEKLSKERLKYGSTSDLNNPILVQSYNAVRLDVYDINAANKPNSVSGFVITHLTTPEIATQMAATSDGSIYFRVRSNSTTAIGSWYKVPTRTEYDNLLSKVNGKMNFGVVTDLNSAIFAQNNSVARFDVYQSDATNKPDSYAGIVLTCHITGNYAVQFAFTRNEDLYTRKRDNSTTQVTEWVKKPTRGEVKSLQDQINFRPPATFNALDLDAIIKATVQYSGIRIDSYSATATGRPNDQIGVCLTCHFDSTTHFQYAVTNDAAIYMRGYNGSTVGSWTKLPTRAEITTINNALPQKLPYAANTADLDALIKQNISGNGSVKLASYPSNATGRPETVAGLSLTCYHTAEISYQWCFTYSGNVWYRTRTATSTIGTWHKLPVRSEITELQRDRLQTQRLVPDLDAMLKANYESINGLKIASYTSSTTGKPSNYNGTCLTTWIDGTLSTQFAFSADGNIYARLRTNTSAIGSWVEIANGNLLNKISTNTTKINALESANTTNVGKISALETTATQHTNKISALESFPSTIYGQRLIGANGCVIPANIICVKHNSRKCDLHISFQIWERGTVNLGAAFSKVAILQSVGLNTLFFYPYQTRCTVEGLGAQDNFSGTTGLMMDGSLEYLTRNYTFGNFNNLGTWGLEGNVYSVGCYYYIDIWGATYT